MVLIILLVTPQRTSLICSQADEANLSKILNKIAEYCERVKNIAMFYICKENIKERRKFYHVRNTRRIKPYGSPTIILDVKTLKLRKTRKHSYLYDYQLINEKQKLHEQRTLLKKNNKRKRLENSELEVRFNAKYLVYGPVGFLSRYWQNYFNYEITGRESLGKIQAAIIRATPKPNNKENWNFAKIWINEKDSSILQIEWESNFNFDGKNIASMSGDFRTLTMWRVTYGIEKNGVRFPSRQHIQEFLVTETGKKYLRNEIITVFNDYKFFIVEYEIKHYPLNVSLSQKWKPNPIKPWLSDSKKP